MFKIEAVFLRQPFLFRNWNDKISISILLFAGLNLNAVSTCAILNLGFFYMPVSRMANVNFAL
jgi:hypothetical protein